MDDRIEIDVENADGVAVIKVSGDLTTAAQDPLDAAYVDIAEGTSRIVIAFRENDHINSAGIGVLIGLAMESRQRDLATRLVHPSPHFRKIFDLVGLNRYVEVFPSLDEALADFT